MDDVSRVDKRKFNGGARKGSGQKALPSGEKKVTISFQVKQKYVSLAKERIQIIINEINNK